MTRRAALTALSAATGALLLACAHPTPPEPESAMPVKEVAIAPDRTGGLHRYVQCLVDDCAKPSPKTLPSMTRPVSQAVSPPPRGVTAPAAPTPPTATAAVAPQSSRLTVRFAFGSAKLDQQAKGQLAGLLPALRSASRVRVVGFTDSIGGKSNNELLANARAWAVRNELRRLAPDQTLELSVAGEALCCYLQPNDSEGGRSVNRRAEIELVPGGTAATAGQRPRGAPTSPAGFAANHPGASPAAPLAVAPATAAPAATASRIKALTPS